MDLTKHLSYKGLGSHELGIKTKAREYMRDNVFHFLVFILSIYTANEDTENKGRYCRILPNDMCKYEKNKKGMTKNNE